MSSDDQARLTAHPRALDLFTDRLGERRRFAQYLHALPPKQRSIFFLLPACDFARPIVRSICGSLGYSCPEICTPLELLAEGENDVPR